MRAYSTVLKTIACFLAIFTGLSTLWSGIAILSLEENGVLSQEIPYHQTSWCKQISFDYADTAFWWFHDANDQQELSEIFSPQESNFRFRIVESSHPDEVLFSNFQETDASIPFVGKRIFHIYDDTTNTELAYDVLCYIKYPLTAADNYRFSNVLYQLFSTHSTLFFPLFLISLVMLIATVIYLLCVAGHRPNTTEIVPNLQDKLPLDGYLAVSFLCMIICGTAIGDIFSFHLNALRLLGNCCLFAILGCIGLATLLTCVTRLKLGKWWENSICWRLGKFCLRLWKRLFRIFRDTIQAIPIVWKVAVAWLAVSFFYIFGGPLAVLMNIGFLLVFCYIALQLQQLKKGGEALVSGNLNYKINTGRMILDLKKHGENLNSISKGFSIALKQKMKSERMKTELITNVSHDIKTPLTSIINYVDLLKKEDLSGNAADYVEVLDRQSHRLKKLTEDLVEASKASTGNIKVTAVPTDLEELIHQAVAEYTEKLALAKLEPIINTPNTPVFALLDGNLTWRVLNNLLSNACKYAQPHTRLYFDVSQAADRILLSVKNISKDPLNIPAEELMERFVRGDASRSTEGSGLGLNIARSLVELQKGSFRLSIDGDLFKVALSFPKTDAKPMTDGFSQMTETEPTEETVFTKPSAVPSETDCSETAFADDSEAEAYFTENPTESPSTDTDSESEGSSEAESPHHTPL